MTATPGARRASSAGSGGTPGETTTRVARGERDRLVAAERRASRRSFERSAAGGSFRAAGVGADHPRRRGAAERAAATPLWPSPTTTTLFAAGSMRHRSFSDERDQREQHGDDPEADDDLRLGPALLLVVVVDRRHQEHALAGELERRRPA